MTQFEQTYFKRINGFALCFLGLHVPVLVAIAWLRGGSPLLAAAVAALLLAGPLLVFLRDFSAPLAAELIAVAAMGISALTIHVTNGMIEGHFEIFVLLALLTVYGRVTPLLVAGVVIALHHVLFWLWLPASVFNYKASFSTVLIHAFFVVLEVAPACWIAQQFGRSIQARALVAEHMGGVADDVSTSSKALNDASGELASSATTQAATMRDTLHSSDELRDLSSGAAGIAKDAMHWMKEMDQSFSQATADLSAVQNTVSQIVQANDKIHKVIRLIEEIAFQTKILSLNAAVEAAGAGQYGAGFAVVANEVGSLAQRSASAATETSTLIDEAIRSAQSGSSSVAALSDAMGRLTNSTAKVKERIEKLQSTSNGQKEAAQVINRALERIGKSAESTASVAEQSASTGAALADHASRLQQLVFELQG